MTASRRLMWAALAAAALTWAAVAVLTTRTEPATERVPAAAHVVEAVPPVEAPRSADAGEPVPAAGDAIIDREGFAGGPYDPDWLPGEVPEFRLERGGASLRLRLVASGERAPISTSVRLWRLGVPEDTAWSAGDEVRADLRVPEAGELIERLPAGRYRLECFDLRRGAEDPPEFVLGEGTNDVAIEVAHRRSFQLRLRVVDETGRALPRAVRTDRPGSTTVDGRGGPHRWLSPRTANAGALESCGTSLAIGCSPGRPGVVVDADGAGCFDLGLRREAGVGMRVDLKWNFQADGHAEVDLHADETIAADTTFVGVAPRLDALVAHVTRPDGKPADFTGTTIIAQSDAIRCPWNVPADAWRDIPVEVRFTCEGFEPMKFVWTANTADAPHVLVPWRR